MRVKDLTKRGAVSVAALLLAALAGAPARGGPVEPWAEIAKLLASDGAAADTFGISVALSGDTALVGAPGDGVSGAAYVFVSSGDVWTEQTKLLPSDGASGDYFGQSVALWGDTAVVGSPGGGVWGAAYVFVRSGDSWTEQARLLPADDGHGFGGSAALSGDTALIGAENDDDNGILSGSAYVFMRVGSSWTERAKLLPHDGSSYDRFGVSVALSGNTALVGSYEQEPLPVNGSSVGGSAVPSSDTDSVNSGAAYVFVKSGNSWIEQTKLLPSGGSFDDGFGESVALSVSADSALVGARLDSEIGTFSGAAYVFVRLGDAWIEQEKLLASDGASGDLFGLSVALAGDTALVGAYLDDDNGTDSGSAYVLVRSGSTWTEQAKLLPKDGVLDDWFGSSVALVDGTALIGAHRQNGFLGSAYVFVKTLLFWDGFESGDTSAWSTTVPWKQHE